MLASAIEKTARNGVAAVGALAARCREPAAGLSGNVRFGIHKSMLRAGSRTRRPRTLGTVAVVVSVVVGACSNPSDIAGVPGNISYNWHVRPILSENCFKCHGPDAEGREASLRLDSAEFAFQRLEGPRERYAIVPGDTDSGELIWRIDAPNQDDVMPPVSTYKSLTDREKAILRQWIADGAEYQRHWAFLTPEVVPAPRTAFDDRAINGIDPYIFAGVEREGMTPSPQADRETLINRVSLTLTGLPPALDEVDAFVADTGPDAYERLVERLLESPRYAEHMAGYWLDLARWSDTDGFLDDHHDRFLWPWRDWVIDAFDRNLPFDEFGTWQLAGDLLPDPGEEQILATAFLRVGKRSTENGAIDEEYKVEYMVERTDNALGTAFMGLTLGCARCHDHRYDPISQREYYELGAFFNSNDEPGQYAPGYSGIQGGPTLPWPSDQQSVDIEAAAARVAEREAAYRAALADATAETEASVGGLLAGDGLPAVATLRVSLQRDLAAHYAFETATPAELTDLPTPRPPRLPPPTLIEFTNSPNARPPPEFETDEERRAADLEARVPALYNAGELELSPAATAGVSAAVIQAPIFRDGIAGQALFFDETNKGFLGRDVGYYDRSQPFSIDFWFYAAEAYDDAPVLNHMGENNSGRTGYKLSIDQGHLWVQLAHSPPANMIALRSSAPFPVDEWTHVTLTYDGSSRAAGTRVFVNGRQAQMRVERDALTRSVLPWSSGDQLDPFLGLAFGTRFRVKAPVGSGLDELRLYDRELAPAEIAVLHADMIGRSVALDRNDLVDALVAGDARVIAALDALTAARSAHDELVTAVPQVLVMGDTPEAVPTHVLYRGVYSEPRNEVEPRGLESVMDWDESLPKNRLGLAQWLFDASNPLTARVFVNRIWQMHFGRGIVETAEDFGSQGSIPTHPELLDWLATEFIESGWDVKALHRLIVTSRTFRQSSVVSEVLAANDPDNALYARGPRWRMTAEMVRDHALAVSGLLVGTIGGESVRPYQPGGIWNPGNSFYEYPESDAIPTDEHHRRTMYTFVKRNALHPALRNFDFMNRTESVARRRSSNTPLQALTLLNDPQYVEAYRALAGVVLTSGDGTRAQLRRMYRLATRTTPTEAMLDRLESYLADQLAAFGADPDKAIALLEVGVTDPDPALDSTTLAALTNVAAVVMNSPDAYTVR